MSKLILLVLAGTILNGCGSDLFSDDCDSEMDDVRDRLGAPEEVNGYDTSDYHNHTWWYWAKGISYTFEWGSIVKSDCDVSTYTFPPIY